MSATFAMLCLMLLHANAAVHLQNTVTCEMLDREQTVQNQNMEHVGTEGPFEPHVEFKCKIPLPVFGMSPFNTYVAGKVAELTAKSVCSKKAMAKHGKPAEGVTIALVKADKTFKKQCTVQLMAKNAAAVGFQGLIIVEKAKVYKAPKDTKKLFSLPTALMKDDPALWIHLGGDRRVGLNFTAHKAGADREYRDSRGSLRKAVDFYSANEIEKSRAYFADWRFLASPTDYSKIQNLSHTLLNKVYRPEEEDRALSEYLRCSWFEKRWPAHPTCWDPLNMNHYDRALLSLYQVRAMPCWDDMLQHGHLCKQTNLRSAILLAYDRT